MQKSNPLRGQIIALWKEKWTAGQIASDLSITRNSVMGIVSRAQRKQLLERRGPSGKRSLLDADEKRERRRVQQWNRRHALVPLPPRPARLLLPTLPLPPRLPEVELSYWTWRHPDGCMFITNDPVAEWPAFCNRPRMFRSSWCPHHYGEVYREGG